MGLFFALAMVGISRLQTRYTSHKMTSAEEFNSASRSVPPGLIAAGIVSAWTWAATLLQSSATAYKFGLSGPWWYASGATIQSRFTTLLANATLADAIVLLFAMIASKLKQHAPHCHTFLEIIRARWGAVAHITFLFFGLATNIIVSTMLILGGSATVSDLTGMSTVAACYLIPLGVSIYVLTGGMRATLIADYSHTLVLYCILISFALIAYGSSSLIGSPAKMWELLHQASQEHPVSGNAQGSYLTMRSKSGLIFGVLNIVGNFVSLFPLYLESLADPRRELSSTIKRTGKELWPLVQRPAQKPSCSAASPGSGFQWAFLPHLVWLPSLCPMEKTLSSL